MATTRIFSDLFPRANVRRLAGFFRAFREAMDDLAGPGRRSAILTPGPNNDTYYEHTYIARYLGLTLLEGEDLIVRDGQALVRTVNGLEPLGLLWRRIDSEFADPLELNEGSQIGTPGLIEALRAGKLSLINALGSGVLEARAMMAFMPRIAEVLTGESLKMPNIATWWCGQQRERDHVRRNAERMMIGAAMDPALPFAMGSTTAFGGALQAADKVADWLDHSGGGLVGQEAVTLSTTPAYREGRLVPRPMTVRVFAARTPAGWTFMPGGYARLGKRSDVTALAMQAGGSVADVWVVAPRPVAPDTLVTTQTAFERAAPGILPARAADNLYWLGRYVERTEGALRLLRAWHLRLAETGDPAEPRLKLMAAYLTKCGLPPEKPVPDALPGLLAAARSSAAKVRDRFSPDGWAALNDLAKTARKLAAKVEAGDDAAQAMGILLRKLSGFSGLVHENMYHHEGWRFLSIGRAQERADGLLMMLGTFAAPKAVPGALEIAVELGDSVMTHQRRYRFGPSRDTVLDLLVLDENNPRAVLHQIALIRRHLARLPQAGTDGRLTVLERALLTMDTELRVAGPADLEPEQLTALRGRLSDIWELLTATYLR